MEGGSVLNLQKFLIFFIIQFSVIQDDKLFKLLNSGGGDLKGSIMKHRGKVETRTDKMDEMDTNVLIEQAEHELKWGDPEKALSYLEKGILIRPENIDLLVLKSRCLVDLSRFK